MNEINQIMVSILMPTYNHENFIEEAILGVIKQKTNFKIELIIGDDFSTDSTRKIIKTYTSKYPSIIKPIFHPYNLGPIGLEGKNNFATIYSFALGKYVAICEGDDYWTDPLKLQKQVDFLEDNDDYILSCHNAMIIDQHNSITSPSKLPLSEQRDFMPLELMKITPVLTLTAVFRNKLMDFPDILRNSPNADTAIFSYLGQFGKSKFHRDIKHAVYRVHEGGIWSTKTSQKKYEMQLETFYNLAQYFKETPYKDVSLHFKQRVLYINTLKINDARDSLKTKLIFSIATAYIKTGEFIEAFRLLKIYGLKWLRKVIKPNLKKF